MNKPDLIEIIYTAGLFDGEGCISLRESKGHIGNPQFILHCTVANCDKDIIIWLQEHYQGSVHSHYDNHPRHNVRWTWYIAAQKALAFLELICPFLRIKKEQAALAIAFQKNKNHSSRRPLSEDEIVLHRGQIRQMQELNGSFRIKR